ncbi:MAG TPA: class I SAM-dependent methyltransferase [Myxococcota bacterium]|nr:class I SAM-dependent methyltransferase [Myxococcota bacterium]
MSVPAERDYVPAAPQLWSYDLLVIVLSCAPRWRRALLAQIAPREGDVIADVGCGTGTQLVKIGRSTAGVTLIGIDPDADVLHRARHKLAKARVVAGLTRGYARDVADLLRDRGVNKLVSSLVFHQVPLEEKVAGLAAMRGALVPGGELHVADYGLQRTRWMRRLFRIVQAGDGYENTEPNARGVLPEVMAQVGFRNVRETAVIATPTGSVSLYRADRGH